MEKLPQRKALRLKDYDYSQSGCYFVTICTKNRSKILSEITVDSLHSTPTTELTQIGQEIANSIKFLKKNYANVLFDKFVIMPNHIHLLLMLLGPESGEGGTPPLYKIIGQLKSFTNKRFNEINNKKGLVLWQRNYYEHIIRNEVEYQEIWNYIDENPAKWEEDRYFREG